MPTVGQIRMQAEASSVNATGSKSGSMPGGSAMPVGFEAFLSALDRSTASRRDAQLNSSQPTIPGAFAMQNLPTLGAKQAGAAKNTDPINLLMAEIAAQGMLNVAFQSPSQVNQINGATNTDGASDIQSLLSSINTQQNQSVLGLANGQQLDPKQTALISQALSKAMKASGQGAEVAMQGQAASLLQALQQQSLGQQNTQTPAQIASAIQSLAQKNGITLPPEIQTQLTNFINKGSETGSIKLLGVEGAGQQTSAIVVEQAGVVDPTKSTTIQNVTDPKTPNVLTSAGDKLAKSKTLDINLMPGNVSDKAQLAKGGAPLMSASAVDAKGAVEAQSLPHTEKQEFKDALNLSELTASNGNLARVDAQNLGNQQKIELKASEVSLASGPLHEQVMSAAKSGGGRIMLELTPPEQGTIRIDLRIDQAGRAHLIVEGASDATKSRLDQGGQNLKNEFAQMGLNLSLDLRQGGQSQQAREQGFGGSRQGFYNSQSTISQSSNTTLAIGSARSGDNRGNSDTVHLYA